EPDWFEVDHKTINEQIDLMQEEMDEAFEKELQKNKIQAYLTGGASISLAAGAMSYLMRAGSLMSSFLATVPIWKGFDPVGVLLAPRKKDKKNKQTEPKPDPTPNLSPEKKMETMFNEDGGEK
ncbi:MAG: hypothetical protein GY702_24270, partial [Desulfobulbaceae bacterium]|nr:hypothetical protein [Desulfobulbaceae bacterium]